jgi:hypothetical protein
LFNRIVECDAELKDTVPVYLDDYAAGVADILPIKLLDPPMRLLIGDSANAPGDAAKNKFFTLSDDGYGGPWRTWMYDNNNGQLERSEPRGIIGQTIQSPQMFFNFEFLQLSKLLGKATAESAERLKKITGEKTALLTAHKEGRAIDIVVPEINTMITDPLILARSGAQFLYLDRDLMPLKKDVNSSLDRVTASITYLQPWYTNLETVFKKHFEKIKVTNNVVFNIRDKNYARKDNGFVIDYFIGRVYHLEVASSNYQNVYDEVFRPNNAYQQGDVL